MGGSAEAAAAALAAVPGLQPPPAGSPRSGERPAPPRGHRRGLGATPGKPEAAALAPQAAGAERSEGSGFNLAGGNGKGGLLSSASRSWQGRGKYSPRLGTEKSIQQYRLGRTSCAGRLRSSTRVMGSTMIIIPSLLASSTGQYPNSECAICNCLAGLASIKPPSSALP